MDAQEDAQEIIDKLNERAEDFCRWMYPEGKKNGSFWEIGDINGKPGDSLRIHISGSMTGVWADHGAGADATGPTLVHLLMRKKGTTAWWKTVVEVKEWLGLEITGDEDRAFRQQHRNHGNFETPSKCYEALAPDGPVRRYLTEQRRISAGTLIRYRVCQNNQLAAAGFPHFDEKGKLRAIKFRDIATKANGDKVQWTDPKAATLGLWGKSAVDDDDNEVVICEGEIDAMSIAETGFSAVSMPNGAKDDKWIERDWKWLQRFSSIIICYDSDEAGRDGLDRAFPLLISRLGRHRCRIARMPDGIKDPNDALVQDRLGDLNGALHAAASVDPATLRHLSEYRAEVYDLFFPSQEGIAGFPLPWTERLRLRPAEMTLWTGINGHGKTTLLLHCLAHLAKRHDQRAILACMESPARKSGYVLTRQFCGHEIRRPEGFDKVYDHVQENLWVYDYVGNAPWKDLIETFRYAHRRYGVSQFVIDSIMTCDIDTDDYNQQSKFIGALAALADETGGHVHVVAHARKSSNEADPPGKMDVAGHANITNRVFNGLTVFRNKAKIQQLKDAHESKEPRLISTAEAVHDAELVCWKQRETGEEFHIQLWMHRASLQFWPEVNPPGKTYLHAS